MKIFNLNDDNKFIGVTENYDNEQADHFTNSKAGTMVTPDCFGCYAANLPTGYTYNLHWNTG